MRSSTSARRSPRLEDITVVYYIGPSCGGGGGGGGRRRRRPL